MTSSSQRFGSHAPLRDADPYDGVIVVDKPGGPTSHDIVDQMRRAFGIKKVGHGGTLDPMATGVLIILTGRGTKLSQRFMGSDKTYEGTIKLGIATNSQDAEGEIISEADPSHVTEDQLKDEMVKRVGDSFQKPPMVSAVKVDGVPLYKHARKGKTVERKSRLIHVYEFSPLFFALPSADFRLRCTKGTYVRTLCSDIGESLGCGAHLTRLNRTQSGKISIKDATPYEDIMHMNRRELLDILIPLNKFA